MIILILTLLAAGQVTNTVDLNGIVYATLDNVAASSVESGNQADVAALPTGWGIAPADTFSHQVAAAHPWGTDCLVLADGR
jgi:hypothetical protein